MKVSICTTRADEKTQRSTTRAADRLWTGNEHRCPGAGTYYSCVGLPPRTPIDVGKGSQRVASEHYYYCTRPYSTYGFFFYHGCRSNCCCSTVVRRQAVGCPPYYHSVCTHHDRAAGARKRDAKTSREAEKKGNDQERRGATNNAVIINVHSIVHRRTLHRRRPESMAPRWPGAAAGIERPTAIDECSTVAIVSRRRRTEEAAAIAVARPNGSAISPRELVYSPARVHAVWPIVASPPLENCTVERRPDGKLFWNTSPSGEHEMFSVRRVLQAKYPLSMLKPRVTHFFSSTFPKFPKIQWIMGIILE